MLATKDVNEVQQPQLQLAQRMIIEPSSTTQENNTREWLEKIGLLLFLIVTFVVLVGVIADIHRAMGFEIQVEKDLESKLLQREQVVILEQLSLSDSIATSANSKEETWVIDQEQSEKLWRRRKEQRKMDSQRKKRKYA